MQLAKEIQYVRGIAFLKGSASMLLVRKGGHAAIIDKLCPIGGEVEVTKESHRGAMIREFREECGIETTLDDWMTFHVERYVASPERDKGGSRVYYMVAELDQERFYSHVTYSHVTYSHVTMEDESIECHSIRSVIEGADDYSHNLDHLVLMASNYLLYPQHRYLEG